jgi:hypothetical protein
MNAIIGKWHPINWYGRVTFDGRELTPARSLKLRNHSPDGFAWGYAGSGPAQLALAILLEAGCTDEQALRHYQEFKTYTLLASSQTTLRVNIDVLGWVKEREARP